jgi:hypothetical protein
VKDSGLCDGDEVEVIINTISDNKHSYDEVVYPTYVESTIPSDESVDVQRNAVIRVNFRPSVDGTCVYVPSLLADDILATYTTTYHQEGHSLRGCLGRDNDYGSSEKTFLPVPGGGNVENYIHSQIWTNHKFGRKIFLLELDIDMLLKLTPPTRRYSIVSIDEMKESVLDVGKELPPMTDSVDDDEIQSYERKPDQLARRGQHGDSAQDGRRTSHASMKSYDSRRYSLTSANMPFAMQRTRDPTDPKSVHGHADGCDDDIAMLYDNSPAGKAKRVVCDLETEYEYIAAHRRQIDSEIIRRLRIAIDAIRYDSSYEAEMINGASCVADDPLSWQRYIKKQTVPLECKSRCIWRNMEQGLCTVELIPCAPLKYDSFYAIMLQNGLPTVPVQVSVV